MKTSIKRVVSSFILSGRGGSHRDDVRVAVFHRVETMPTFPGHWAPCSGSLEPDDPSPWHAARRELREETNLVLAEPNQPGGVYVDVPFRENTIIRVYPFTVNMMVPSDADADDDDDDTSPTVTLELRGTEHDHYKFVSVSGLEQLEPAVPGLARAFHHATFGRYLSDRVLPPAAQDWAADHENGAAVMAQNALRLVSEHGVDPNVLIMLRPSMVAISNALRALLPLPHASSDSSLKEEHALLVADGNKVDTTPTADQVLKMLQDDARASIEFAVQTIQSWISDYEKKQQQKQSSSSSSSSSHEPYVIATHSRSSTVLQVLQRLVDEGNHELRILCGQSTPGDEGVLMTRDLLPGAPAKCVPDRELQETIRHGTVHLLLLGCDCLTEHDVVNKVGTKTLVQLARETTATTAEIAGSTTKVVCCVDRWKVWDDIFPPPLEDIFECIPRESFDFILLPPPTSNNQCEASNADG